MVITHRCYQCACISMNFELSLAQFYGFLQFKETTGCNSLMLLHNYSCLFIIFESETLPLYREHSHALVSRVYLSHSMNNRESIEVQV